MASPRVRRLADSPWYLRILRSLLKAFRRLIEWLLGLFRSGPLISNFHPPAGPKGIVVEIVGSGFAAKAQDNDVQIGGERALVLSAASNRLEVLTGPATVTGPVAVRVGTDTATGPRDFELSQQLPGADGPPIVYQGRGSGASQGSASPTGILRVLV